MTSLARTQCFLLLLAASACSLDRPADPHFGSYRLVAVNGIWLNNQGGTTANALTLHSGLRVWTGSTDLRADHTAYEERWICFDHSGGGTCSARIYADGAWATVGTSVLRLTFGDSVRMGTFVDDTLTVYWPTDTLRYQHQ
jgi:hypothetical protein